MECMNIFYSSCTFDFLYPKLYFLLSTFYYLSAMFHPRTSGNCLISMGISVLPDFRPPRSDFRYPRSGFRPRVPEIRLSKTEIRPMGLKWDPPFRWIVILWMCPKFTFFKLFLDVKSFFSDIKYFLSYSKMKHICLNQRSDFRPQRSDFRPTLPGIRPLCLISVPKGLKMDPWHLKYWLTHIKSTGCD